MNKILFIILIMLGISFAQDNVSPDQKNGERIFFGNAFWDAESTKLKISGLSDSLYASGAKDTLYSEAIPQSRVQGYFYNLSAFFEGISGTSASIGIDIRLGETFNGPNIVKDAISSFTPSAGKNVKWGPWKFLMTCKKDSLYKMSLSQSDSSWWQPANFRQFRIREADADTVRPWISDHIR